ncbi:hypothetical protein [Empedobacter brevis]|uniref:Uncharacterized protein n=1 Tax=Empedobacter brevis NBRC 14943 = ATCC 43319 TaxID=1218108 RepID=A0A511ND28_9FLAO|nr:hypothetical protein [Empedobacter brevis]GEM50723.1 hypothetical protein EB1_05130 [Empedobacter brevis NBRC 14943 = ATCC 43319]
MKNKNLNQLGKTLKPLTQSEKGQLKGGFSAFGASVAPDVAKNVNVDVAGHTCACSCDSGTVVIK